MAADNQAGLLTAPSGQPDGGGIAAAPAQLMALALAVICLLGMGLAIGIVATKL